MWLRKRHPWSRQIARKPQEARGSDATGQDAASPPAEDDEDLQKRSQAAAIADQLLEKWADAAKRDELREQLRTMVSADADEEAPADLESEPCRVRLALLVSQATELIESEADAQGVLSALQRWVAVVQTRHYEVNPLALTEELAGCLEGTVPSMEPRGGLQAALTEVEVPAEVRPEGLSDKVVESAQLVNSHLEPQLLRRELAHAVEAEDFGAAAALCGELEKLFPTPEAAAAASRDAAEASTDNEEVVIPEDERQADSAPTQLQHMKSLAEIERRRAREKILEQEVIDLRRQLHGQQEGRRSLQDADDDMLPQEGRAAMITNPSKDKEPYLGWLCTIVGRRQDDVRTWVLKLMWKHPLGDLVQMPADSFISHPALDRMRGRLGELPCRQPRWKAEVDALEARIKHSAVPRGPGRSEASAGTEVAARSPNRRVSASDSPIFVRQAPHGEPAAQGAASPRRRLREKTPIFEDSPEEPRKRRREEAAIPPADGVSALREVLRTARAEDGSAAGAAAPREPERVVPRGERERNGWTQEEEARLIAGQQRYGNHWEMIRKKCNLMHRKGTQIREKFRNLRL